MGKEAYTLYKVDEAGRVRELTIERENNAYRTTSGLIDGKKVTSQWKYAAGVNKGKANELFPEEHAKRIVKSSLKVYEEVQGYCRSIEEAKNNRHRFQCMLASKWDSVKDKTVVDEEHPIYIQRKLDGCVSGDMKVHTDVGDVLMRDVVEKGIGTFVYSYNTRTGKQEMKPILGRYRNVEDIQESQHKWYKIKLSDGRELKLTGNHRVYLPKLRCWRRVDELSAADLLLNIEY